jgi:hypothetical protein
MRSYEPFLLIYGHVEPVNPLNSSVLENLLLYNSDNVFCLAMIDRLIRQFG